MMTYKKKHNLFMIGYGLLLIIVSVLAADCSSVSDRRAQSVKPQLPEAVYVSTPDTLPFVFDISNRALFHAQKNKPGEVFCHVAYPDLRAKLYCTWHSMKPENMRIMSEESHALAYAHVQKATSIHEHLYSHPENDMYGILYDIQGPVATPVQLALTDSATFFFHASLYFEAEVANTDSLAPYVDYVRKDIERLAESFSTNN